jgi:hypothetical protein
MNCLIIYKKLTKNAIHKNIYNLIRWEGLPEVKKTRDVIMPK